MHILVGVDDNCNRNFPSISDIQTIVRDTLANGMLFHVVFTPIGEFRIMSVRAKFLEIDDELLEMERMLCSGALSFDNFALLIKK